MRGSRAVLLGGDEADEGADDAIQLRGERLGRGDGAAALGELEAGERLARGAERRVIAQLPIGPAAVHSLGDVERNAAAGAAQLPP